MHLLSSPQLTPPCPALNFYMKKIILPQWLRSACAGIMLGSGTLIFTGCVATVREPGPEAYYNYQYYPDADVYYYPEDHIYYWNDGRRWRSGRELPPRIVIRQEHYEYFRGHSQQPWMERHQGEGRAGEIRHGRGDDRDRDNY
jgi:hypothetical protein